MKTKQRVTPQFTERYQWKANREGGQRIGNKQTIAPLTSDLFYRYLADGVRPNKFFEYRREYPNVTHISLVEKWDGSIILGIPAGGRLEELRPTRRAFQMGWVKKVESFESA